MAIDGFVLKCIVHELNSSIIESKIDKIYQPEKDEIIINLRSHQKNQQLLLSSSSIYPRLNITKEKSINPQSAPMFCMFLRKHLTGGIIKKIIQINLDRIVMIEIATKDELRADSIKRVFIEIMGKHSNIIITDINNIVIECLKRIGHNISSKRQLYPGIKYTIPNFDKKINPLKCTREKFKFVINNTNLGHSIESTLVNSFDGVSPLISREICYLAKINDSNLIGQLSDENINELYNSFNELVEKLKNNLYSPLIYIDEITGEFFDFHCFNLKHLFKYSTKAFSTINDILDLYFYEKSKYQNYKQKTADLRKVTSNLLNKNKRKFSILSNDLIKSEDRLKYKVFGELIIANIYKIKLKDEILKTLDYYTDKEVEIPLDKQLNPSQNAQKYFKKYNKSKIAEENLKEQLSITNENIKYLENILFSLENAIEIEVVEEIREELIQNGFIRKSKKSKVKIKKSALITIISKDGFEIYVGKNNIQNDLITFSIASRDDMWLHAKDIPGSHVVIKSEGKQIPDTTLEEAASYAAYYSKNKNSSKVEVIYTLKNNVRKPNNAKPGLVVFSENFSMLIEPVKPEY